MDLHEHEDAYYLRYLRARKFELTDTYKMLEEDIAWRVDTGDVLSVMHYYA